MVIAVNARFLLKEYLEGYGNFISETFSRLAHKHPEHQFIFIFDRPYPPEFIFSNNVIPEVAGPETRHPLLWWWWFNYRIPKILKKYKADVFVSADGFCSLTTKVPQLLVIHDLAFVHYPKFVKGSHLWFYKRYTPAFLKMAKCVATVSEFSKQDILKCYKIAGEKISVVYNGVNENFQPIGFEEREKVKEKFADGNEYFLCTGAIHPRKNLINLIKAFSFFKKRQKSGMQLLIAGRPGWKNEDFFEALRLFKYRNDVKMLGYLETDELVKVTAGAYTMVYPSLFEGFGIPPLEAMRSGVPVLTSKVSAIPEICSDAALYFDPNNPADISQKMMLIYKDEEMRKTMIEKGEEHVKQYNWDKTSDNLWRMIEECAER